MPPIVLPPYCDRGATLALHPEFLAQLGAGPIEIDASGSERVGQLMLQLLLAARRSSGGATITASPALREAAELAGLTGELFDTCEAGDDQ